MIDHSGHSGEGGRLKIDLTADRGERHNVLDLDGRVRLYSSVTMQVSFDTRTFLYIREKTVVVEDVVVITVTQFSRQT